MYYPSWSPDGRRIVAQGERCEPLGFNCGEDFVTGLWVHEVATGTAREILYLDGEGVGIPAWSPNGRWIAFTRSAMEDPAGVPQLWLVRPDGSDLRQVTQLAGGAASATWSPNGRRLAFNTATQRSRRAVATIRADGSGSASSPSAGSTTGSTGHDDPDRRAQQRIVEQVPVDQAGGRPTGDHPGPQSPIRDLPQSRWPGRLPVAAPAVSVPRRWCTYRAAPQGADGGPRRVLPGALRRELASDAPGGRDGGPPSATPGLSRADELIARAASAAVTRVEGRP
jgi:hypothetical protein